MAVKRDTVAISLELRPWFLFALKHMVLLAAVYPFLRVMPVKWLVSIKAE